MGMHQKAFQLAEKNGWLLARQFETDANALLHENTTGREIRAVFEAERLDYYATGYGTGGPSPVSPGCSARSGARRRSS
jgi:cysteine synthase A